MIIEMRKVFIAARAEQRRTLLEALRSLGVVHLQAVDPSVQVPEELRQAAAQLRRARQILASVAPTGTPPALEPAAAVEEILALARRREENAQRLSVLHREADRLAPWGELRLSRLAALQQAGVAVRFYRLPSSAVDRIRADLVEPLAELPGRRRLVAAAALGGEPEPPPEAEPLALPARDLHALRAEAAEVEAALAEDAGRLARLARLDRALLEEERRLGVRHEFAVADAGGLGGEALFALQGWVPAERAGALAGGLAARGVHAAVQMAPPGPDELPPTLVRYAPWARPIKGLFEILGTQPGYREYDVSPFFMVALPLFAAFLIGDFGYGLAFALIGALLYRRLAPKIGVEKMRLMIIIGLATMAWGVLSATYFSFTPDSIARALGTDAAGLMAGEGFWAGAARAMAAVAPLYRTDEQAVQLLLIQVAFLLGTIHLSLAQLRRALFLAPSRRAIACLGWILFLWGMLGLIWSMFFAARPLLPARVVEGLLLAGGLLVILFTHPVRNPAKRLGLGLASALLPALSAFSDTISYIRLMAVGLATVYIGDAFNSMSIQLAGAATWFAGAPLLVAGHTLNVAMAVIAVFAHGVRLNMLEFSTNAGIEWSGYPYEPFAEEHPKEI